MVLGSRYTKKTVTCKSSNSGLIVKVQDILEANTLFQVDRHRCHWSHDLVMDNLVTLELLDDHN